MPSEPLDTAALRASIDAGEIVVLGPDAIRTLLDRCDALEAVYEAAVPVSALLWRVNEPPSLPLFSRRYQLAAAVERVRAMKEGAA